MPSQASLGFNRKRKAPPAGITDRLAGALRDLVELVPSPEGCRACLNGETTCALHRRRTTALEALHEYERPEA